MPLNFLNSTVTVFCLSLLAACHTDTVHTTQVISSTPPKKDTAHLLKYAKRFAIEKNGALTLVHVFGNKLKPGDTTATFAIAKDSALRSSAPKRAVFIKSPCRKIVALSSIYANIICDLGKLNQLAAIHNMDYVINPQIIARFAAGNLLELAKGPEPDLERTITLAPDIVFTFGMGNAQDLHPKLAQSKIPIAISIDHLEESPLARAEWIKFYAVFVDKEQLADSLFLATEKHYRALQAIVHHATWRPDVLTEIKYGDAWYVPGGKSFMAQLLKDAGAHYLWEEDANAGSLPLSFEQVYAKAKDADFWLNLSMIKTKAELLSYEPRYVEFKAFKVDHVYNNNKVANAKGYSTYWETGMTYPDRILSDLISIFHPELLPEAKNDLYYYRQIN